MTQWRTTKRKLKLAPWRSIGYYSPSGAGSDHVSAEGSPDQPILWGRSVVVVCTYTRRDPWLRIYLARAASGHAWPEPECRLGSEVTGPVTYHAYQPMEARTQLLGVDILTSSCFHCNNNNVSSNVHVLPLRLASLHLGPCSVLPGTCLVRELPISHRVLQYGYHISALNQIQATLTCRAAPPLHSHGLPTCIPMSDAMFSLVTSMFTVGGFLGSSIAGMVMERHGRKAALQFSGLSVAVGSALMAIAPSTVLLLLGRQ
jgi:hypothetical protein